MVSPKKSTTSSSATTTPPSSSYSYLLFAIKVILVIIIILLLPKLVTGAGSSSSSTKKNKHFVQKLLEMKLDCTLGSTTTTTATTACSELLPEENAMCVSHCISPTCHQQIYASNPLEDGEMDVKRAKEFETCVKEQLRLERRKARNNRSLLAQKEQKEQTRLP